MPFLNFFTVSATSICLLFFHTLFLILLSGCTSSSLPFCTATLAHNSSSAKSSCFHGRQVWFTLHRPDGYHSFSRQLSLTVASPYLTRCMPHHEWGLVWHRIVLLFPSYSVCYVNILTAPSLLDDLALYAENTSNMAKTRKPAIFTKLESYLNGLKRWLRNGWSLLTSQRAPQSSSQRR